MNESSLEWERVADSRVRVPQHVVHRQFASETVLLNAQTGQYYGMDEFGARFFEVLSDSPDLRYALSTLSEEFEEEPDRIRDDMIRFCDELLSLGLIELEEPGEGAQPVRRIPGNG